jgi:hypothetical protein
LYDTTPGACFATPIFACDNPPQYLSGSLELLGEHNRGVVQGDAGVRVMLHQGLPVGALDYGRGERTGRPAQSQQFLGFTFRHRTVSL